MGKIEKMVDSLEMCSPLRLTHRTRYRGKNRRSIRVKCGCCSMAIEIFPEEDPTGDIHVDSIEINGVMGSVDQWRKVFLPLLGIEAK